MKVAVFSTRQYDQEYLDKYNTGHNLTYFNEPLTAATVKMAEAFDAICLFVNDKADKHTMEELARCGVKLIALRSAGFNNIDLHAAAANHIKVVRVPAYSPQAVAEHAVALILTLNRKTHKAYNRVRESNFSLEKLLGFNLFGKTVGVIGTGKIGNCFCHIMLGFGCKVLAFDIAPFEELKQYGVIYTSLDELLQQSDIISLHCPLTPETRHLIDKAALAKMKTGAMLINTSRGAVISTKDVIKALKTGKLGYLGIDVYEQEEHLFFKDLSEKVILDDLIARLMTFPNVLITAHQGFFTREALQEIATTTFRSLDQFENGQKLENEIALNLT
ncbi:2-hydroxyacid dehydrogenase [Pontibacter sp. KCTC 32443]|uniref:2-hydroxyacid dehydrogenase n=1 Tax=Pontibacter TaxID=323449 RepID=UPI00164DDFB6|nr:MULTISPECIES: 2-hydroxyacid dehydrogenase [Pontibacter]MBC5772855.1 2-hydroxyacid dehydrogenase [Pontibacter sp. KCTC 32443]